MHNYSSILSDIDSLIENLHNKIQVNNNHILMLLWYYNNIIKYNDHHIN